MFENMEDLRQKADYYLQNEAERLEIALNGYEKTARYHTYEMRLAEMIRILSGS